MRELKFKTWFPIQKIMSISFTLRDALQHKVYFCDDAEINLQSTGLFGINGVEIYEGDIVKNPNWIGSLRRGNFLTVKFTNCQWDFESDDYIVPAWSRATEFEIIGNIYENSELLEAQNGAL